MFMRVIRHEFFEIARFSFEFCVIVLNVKAMKSSNRANVPPRRMWVGLILIAVCWPLDWFLPGVRTAYLFFPLWLGYILTVDALVRRRTGTSIGIRSLKNFVLLFVVSSPVWWLFELINSRTRNWEYLGSGVFTLLEYNALCTLCFSIVMPAIFETAELARSFRWVQRCVSRSRLPATQSMRATLFLIGIAMLVSLLIWPKYFYPFVWSSVLFILEPLNRWLGRRTLLEKLERGDWRLFVSLSTGALICGFFWELWNFYSFPKWIYHTPGVNFLHVFEMPLPGYIGYIPFALELYALKNFLWPSDKVTTGE
jgi:hypothetical protein